jgi:hypothetical protein
MQDSRLFSEVIKKNIEAVSPAMVRKVLRDDNDGSCRIEFIILRYFFLTAYHVILRHTICACCDGSIDKGRVQEKQKQAESTKHVN